MNDPFTQRRLSKEEIATRFLKAREQHRRASDIMWLGRMVQGFTEDELVILERAGFLSEHDLRLLQHR